MSVRRSTNDLGSLCLQETGKPVLLRPHHFAADGSSFLNEHMRPFFRRMEQAIRHAPPDSSAIYHRTASNEAQIHGNNDWVVFAEAHIDFINLVCMEL